MQTLRVQHVEGTNQFVVVRLKDGKQADPVDVPSPAAQLVGGRVNSSLMAELRWYLERFLDYPFPPETEHAQEVQQALKDWGRVAFTALFGGGQGRDFLRRHMDAGEEVCLQVASDHASVLAWPWEALVDPDAGHLAFQAGIERRLNKVSDPPPLFASLPKDRVNILLVICRPFDHDVGFRSIARPLVELIAQHRLPAKVTVLRPPTFDRLREVLKEQTGQFHIVHFDGHGGYGQGPALPGPHVLQGPQGHLVFESNDVDPKPDPVSADKLRELLREYRVPAVVLNACQSATLDENAEDPFASVAASLIKGGVRSVVAMAYSLYVSAAQHFLPAYYRTLFEDGDAVSAVRAGRRELLAHPERVCSRGTCPLDDWLVPVVYQNDPLSLSFGKAETEPVTLPDEAQDSRNPYGFVGRDQALLRLERALRRPAPGVLIHGLGGVGKTTLARGFLDWLKQTDGLGAGVLWLSFQEIRSAEYVLNQIIQPIYGPNALVAPLDQKLNAAVQALRERRFLLVWDNFESASGIEDTAQTAMLSPEDRGLLKELLQGLRGGKSRVLITSRSPEAWLGPTLCFPLPLAGLFGEERWSFCQAILRDLGLPANQNDPELVALMDALVGHPLMMRAVLPELARRSPAEILKAVQSNLGGLGQAGDEVQAKLFATLRFVEQSLPEDLRPLLVPLALHDRFAHASLLEAMAEQIPGAATRPVIDRFLTTLGQAGLVTDRGYAIFELHPALTGYLRSLVQPEAPANLPWTRAFVDVMGSVADAYARKPLHEKRAVFHMHAENFRRAQDLAERLSMGIPFAAFLQGVAAFAFSIRDFATAERLFERLGEYRASTGDEESEAAAYHQVGLVAQGRRDFEKAEAWFGRSLAIKERRSDEIGAAGTYHQLGAIALQLGERNRAEEWLSRALTIFERRGHVREAAKTHAEIGHVALERGDNDRARALFLRALDIFEREADMENEVAGTYHNLGRIAQAQRNFEQADVWYRRALTIFQKETDEHHTADVYHQLAVVANERGKPEQSEDWCYKALAILEKQGSRHDAARIYGQLGIIAGNRQNYESSVKWLLKAIRGFIQTNNLAEAQRNAHNLMAFYERAPVALRPRLRQLWEEAGLGPFPEGQS